MVEIVNPKDRYVVDDVVRIRITAKDLKSVSKTHGGDYIRVKLYTKKAKSSWAIDVTNDLGNGTYLADVQLRWPGQVQVIVSLIHPSEAVQVLKRIRENTTWRSSFTGQYVGKNDTKEKVLCLPKQIENVSNKTFLQTLYNLKTNIRDKRVCSTETPEHSSTQCVVEWGVNGFNGQANAFENLNCYCGPMCPLHPPRPTHLHSGAQGMKTAFGDQQAIDSQLTRAHCNAREKLDKFPIGFSIEF